MKLKSKRVVYILQNSHHMMCVCVFNILYINYKHYCYQQSASLGYEGLLRKNCTELQTMTISIGFF